MPLGPVCETVILDQAQPFAPVMNLLRGRAKGFRLTSPKGNRICDLRIHGWDKFGITS
ncbi:hypothetical protein FHT17_004444 [Novosphingobium sp. SG916]|nr:hypothetical protein [Novosphingobium sp. SG720]NMN06893.1 hypothetical protein [Novosphingobium sp. SG919]NMN89520.1 hypothetical protein [Novosphingobium sp. SG916]